MNLSQTLSESTVDCKCLTCGIRKSIDQWHQTHNQEPDALDIIDSLVEMIKLISFYLDKPPRHLNG